MIIIILSILIGYCQNSLHFLENTSYCKLDHCIQCNYFGIDCTKCEDDYFLMKLNLIGYCIKCPIRCLNCLDYIGCQQCDIGFYKHKLSNGSDMCIVCSENCQKGNCLDYSGCKMCDDGFYLWKSDVLNSNVCYKAAFCREYKNFIGCINCIDGYKLIINPGYPQKCKK